MTCRFRVSAIVCAIALATPGFAQSLDLSWHTLNGGGGRSSGGTLELIGTVAQPAAGPTLSGGQFDLVGGFWSGVSNAQPCPGATGDANCDGLVNFFDLDPFVEALFDLPTYRTNFCNGAICAVDVDCDGLINFFDIDPFVTCLFASCAQCP